MLYPQENGKRSVLSLDGIWNFKLDEEGMAQAEKWGDTPLKDAELFYVPASFNDQREEAKYRVFRGKAYYERTAVIPEFYQGQRWFLRFDAVTHDACVWIDGKKVCEHRGGFLPFEVELTKLVKAGTPFRLTVSADNTIGHDTLPVGNEGGNAFFGSDNAWVPAVREAKLWRGAVNLPNFDFFNYAGIHRHVRIYTTPMSYIKKIVIVPAYKDPDKNKNQDKDQEKNKNQDKNENQDKGKEGIVSYRIEIEEEKGSSGTPSIQILDREDRVVASGRGMEGKLIIPDARLWEPYPGDPYLYRMKVCFGEDEYTEEFGIRTVEVQGKEFRINGKPFYFKGFGKHEDSAVHGRGMDEVLNVKDVSLLHWIGANSFRTSHYPYAEEMYRLCDREGIVIIDETPAVGISAGADDPYETLPLLEYHRQIIKDMIARDANHPSVVMWSLGNEPDTESHAKSAYTYWRDLYDTAHETDPQSRPVTLVCCQNDYTKDLVTRTMDVVCINRYYGWYNLSGDLDAACYAWNLELDFWEETGKPVMCSEYGADTLPGNHGTVGEMFTEEFQTEYYRRIDAEFDRRDFFIGEHCWNFADFGTLQGVMRPDGNRKGLFTRDRRPKMAAHFLRERWSAIPNFGYKT